MRTLGNEAWAAREGLVLLLSVLALGCGGEGELDEELATTVSQQALSSGIILQQEGEEGSDTTYGSVYSVADSAASSGTFLRIKGSGAYAQWNQIYVPYKFNGFFVRAKSFTCASTEAAQVRVSVEDLGTGTVMSQVRTLGGSWSDIRFDQADFSEDTVGDVGDKLVKFTLANFSSSCTDRAVDLDVFYFARTLPVYSVYYENVSGSPPTAVASQGTALTEEKNGGEVTIPEFPSGSGNHVGKHFIPADPATGTGNKRAEVTSQDITTEGYTRTYKWRVYVPSSTAFAAPAAGSNTWMMVNQWKTYPCGANGEQDAAIIAAQLCHTSGQFNKTSVTPDSRFKFVFEAKTKLLDANNNEYLGPGCPDPMYVDIVRGQWMYFLMQIKWTKTRGAGFIKLHVRDESGHTIFRDQRENINTLFDAWVPTLNGKSCNIAFSLGLYADIDHVNDNLWRYLYTDGVEVWQGAVDTPVDGFASGGTGTGGNGAGGAAGAGADGGGAATGGSAAGGAGASTANGGDGPGASGAGASAAGSGASATSGPASFPGDSGDSESCGCRVPRSRGTSPATALGVATVTLLLARRRRLRDLSQGRT